MVPSGTMSLTNERAGTITVVEPITCCGSAAN
jgi:hypothetical protein